MSFGAHEHVLVERHRALLRDDHLGVAAHRLEPVAELLGVRDRRAQRDHPHVLGAGG